VNLYSCERQKDWPAQAIEQSSCGPSFACHLICSNHLTLILAPRFVSGLELLKNLSYFPQHLLLLIFI